MFKVKKKVCNECLFSNNKIVSDERRDEILKECENEQTFFICHKSSIEGGQDCCRGFYNNNPKNKVVGLANYLKIVQFVD